MNDRFLAISILQQARDALAERLTRHIVKARTEIEAEVENGGYMNELDSIYELYGRSLAQVNALLSQLPPAGPTFEEVMGQAREKVDRNGSGTKADFRKDAKATSARAGREEVEGPFETAATCEPAHDSLEQIASRLKRGDYLSAGRMISSFLELEPTERRRRASQFARRMVAFPSLAQRIAVLADGKNSKQSSGSQDHTAAVILGECFEFSDADALAIVRELKSRHESTASSRSNVAANGHGAS